MASNTIFSQKIQIDLIRLLYQQISPTLYAESVAAISLAFVLWGFVSLPLLIAWLVFNLVFAGIYRHILVFYYRRFTEKHGFSYTNMQWWLRWFALGVFFSGISWGLAGSLLMAKNDIVRQTFTILLLTGVTSVANVVYSPKRFVYTLFLMLAFVPFSVWLILQGHIFVILGMLALIYIALMLGVSFYSNKLIVTSLQLRYENIDLIQQANFDSLTGLPNRNLFHDRLSQAMLHADTFHRNIAVLFLDLDSFKSVIDTLGNVVGDQLLIAVSERLKKYLGENRTISRSAGDEFIIILDNLKKEPDVIPFANDILRLISTPFSIDNNNINISVSFGISFYPKDALEPEILVRHAGMAMYQAKEMGRHNFQFFKQEMNEKIMKRVTLENQLRDALKENEFSLYYQPIIDAKTGLITTMEALLRPTHPVLADLPLPEFISLAEETGLIIPLGEWILKKACQHLKEWELYVPDVPIAVNISPLQFKQVNFLKTITQLLEDTPLNPRSLVLEITESVMMEDIEKTIAQLKKLKERGVGLVVDDFGTGYSSLNYLKQLPIDKLKIDQSFIQDIPFHADDAAITSAIIALGNRLKLKVIAEGVERLDQVKFLVNERCDEMQGFYFSQPLPSQDCVAFIIKNIKSPFKL